MLDRPTTREGWLARAAALKIEGRAFIDGAYVAAAVGETFAKVSPIDGKVFADVADCGEADIDRAVQSARNAFESGVWRDADPAHKKKVLLRFAELIREHAEEIALLETLDVGKPIANSLSVDVPFCANCIQYYAEFADKLIDEVAPVGANDVAMVRKEPLGVVGAIVPWNYPLIIAAWKIGPALVAGNSVDSQAGRAVAARGAAVSAACAGRRGCRTACSMSCRASARRPASPWRCIRTST